MPRFENKGFDPEKRNRNNDLDRTVPEDENYYGYSPVDLNFNNRQRKSDTRQSQRSVYDENGINPCDIPTQSVRSNNLEPPQRFRSETPTDFEPSANTRQHERVRRSTDKPAKSHNSSSGKNKKAPNKKGKLPKMSVGKGILAFVLVLVLIIVGSVGVVMGRINYSDKIENEYVSADSLESSSMVKNILILGVDARSDENAEETRSDTMMLVSLDAKHRCIKMVSFLRDTWIYIPTLGYEQRLNAACSSGGYQGVVDAIEYNFGIKIDGYAVADFEMFKVLVDSLGGVEVDVTQEEADEVTNHPNRYGNVTLEAGKYKLSGEQALAYCRIRKIDTDFVRTQRQRTVMSAILSSAKSANPFKLYKMAFNSAPYIETNLSKGELMSVAAQALICLSGEMHQTKVPFEGTWDYATISGNSVISINTEENKEMLKDYIYNKSSADIIAEEAESESE